MPYYSVYFSPGVVLEARVLAGYLTEPRPQRLAPGRSFKSTPMRACRRGGRPGRVARRA